MTPDEILAKLFELRERRRDVADQNYQALETACLFIARHRGEFKAYIEDVARLENSNDNGMD